MRYFQIILFFALVFSGIQCSEDYYGVESTGGQGISGSITRFQVLNGYLYGLNQNEIQTYDLSDADNPKLVHRLEAEYGLETITIYDGTIYIGATDGLYILGLDQPDAPVLLSKTFRNGGFLGCDPVVVRDNYAYSTVKIVQNFCGDLSAFSALLIFDVSDQNNPSEVFRLDLNIPNGLGLYGDYLLVCDEGDDSLRVFDISKPDEAVATDFDIPLIDPVDLIVDGTRLIVSTKTSFVVFDAADLGDVKKLATIDL